MGSRRPPCPRCGGFLVKDRDYLQNGDTVSCIRCLNCGERIIPPPKCPEPSIDITLYRRPPNFAQCRHGADPTYSASTRLGICTNCGRHIPLVANHRCKFCENRKDNLEEARVLVDAWLEAGKPCPLGTFVKWRCPEDIGREVRSLRCG